MDEINNIFSIDIKGFCLTLCMIMLAIISVKKLVEQISEIAGKPVKWLTEKNRDHGRILALQGTLENHSEENKKNFLECVKADAETKESLKIMDKKIDKLSSMFLDKQIADMRFDIIDVASSISMGNKYSVEQLNYVIRIHDDYDKLLKENGLTNGQVAMSIEVIQAEYRRLTAKNNPSN